MFTLHERLQQDCFEVGDLPLSRLLLMNNASVPWLILVPRVEGISELHQLALEQQYQLLEESNVLAHFLVNEMKADKLNIAAIGNLVPQLHVHHVARFQDDPCWPAPVWGNLPANPYQQSTVEMIINETRDYLKQHIPFEAFPQSAGSKS